MRRKIAILAAVLAVAFAVMMLTTRSSRFAVENAVELGQPAVAVWEVLAAVEGWPAWWPGMLAARVSPGWQEGAVLTLVLAGNPEKSPARIVILDPPREVAWTRGGVLGSFSRTRLRLEPAPAGTRMHFETSIHGPQALFARITGRREFEKYHQAVLGSLHRHIEHQRMKVDSRSEPPRK